MAPLFLFCLYQFPTRQVVEASWRPLLSKMFMRSWRQAFLPARSAFRADVLILPRLDTESAH
jgi:hypothetical protein